MMPIAQKLLARDVPLVLDLDDIESKALRRLSELQSATLGRVVAAVKRRESAKLAEAEERVGARAHKVLVCSAEDQQELAQRLGLNRVAEMPNGIRLPPNHSVRERSGPLRILFVGSLDYAPNQDALMVLAGGLAGRVSRAVPQGVAWRVVGRRPPVELASRVRSAGLELIADAPSLDGHYHWADAVIVPLRSGGGTRIKILEALAWQLPVVSTTIGAEGLQLVSGRHLIIADTDDEFANAFAWLAQDEAAANRIGQLGYRKVQETYAQVAITARILDIHEDAGRG
jgi:glycosyltransferase involved in cell wall biosynthesis